MSHLNLVVQYVKHQIGAYNRHGIHSPFVYAFLEDVLYADERSGFKELEQLKDDLLQDERVIQITDLGAGSKINQSNNRLVKDIAKNSSKPSKYGRLFNRMVRYYKTEQVIELGTSLGLSTVYFAHNNSLLKVTTIEGCPETLKIAKSNFEKLQLNNIQTLQGDFKERLSEALTPRSEKEIIFFDGNHQEQATLEYFETALKNASSKSIFIFDDIHWSTGMTKAWNKIKGHPQTVVTLDLFFIGIVFFDERLTPQNFNIRF